MYIIVKSRRDFRFGRAALAIKICRKSISLDRCAPVATSEVTWRTLAVVYRRYCIVITAAATCIAPISTDSFRLQSSSLFVSQYVIAFRSALCDIACLFSSSASDITRLFFHIGDRIPAKLTKLASNNTGTLSAAESKEKSVQKFPNN